MSDTPRRVRVHHLREAKERGEKITMLTAYDTPTARIFDEAGTDVLLVGDSLADNFYGHPTTLPITVEAMLHHTAAVVRGTQRALVVADLPFGSYEVSPQRAFETSVRFLKEAGAHAVKFEGGRRLAEHVAFLTANGVPVMGHVGFTPQAENQLGGKRVQGRGDDGAERVTADALALQDAGAFAVVLEMVPVGVAAQVTEVLSIPTIGIGAGPSVDGQVLVWPDMVGLSTWSPRFAKRWANVREAMLEAARAYGEEVRGGTVPGPEHGFEQ